MRLFDFLLIMLLVFFWGVNWVFIKLAVMAFPPVFAMVLRFIIVALCLIPFIRKVPRDKLWQIFGIAFFLGVMYFGLMFTGVHYVPAGQSSILVQLQVPAAAIFSAIILKEKIRLRAAIGIAIALAGVIVTIGLPKEHSSLIGMILLVLAAISSGYANVQVRALGSMNPLILNGVIALMAAPLLLLISGVVEHHQMQSFHTAHWVSYVAVLYTAVISSIVCYSVWFKMLQKYPVNKVMPFTLLTPVISIIAAGCMVGEQPSPHVIIGGLICMIGLALVVIQKSEK